MNVLDFQAVVQVQDERAMRAFLERRDGDGFNGFWCCHATQFPALHVLAHGGLACVTYHPADGTPEVYVKGGGLGLAGGETQFKYDSTMAAEPRANNLVVDWGTAVEVASRFLASAERPTGVSWLSFNDDRGEPLRRAVEVST